MGLQGLLMEVKIGEEKLPPLEVFGMVLSPLQRTAEEKR